MSFQAYLDNIKAKTGKTPEDFRAIATEKGLTRDREIMDWLMSDFGLGHGHARAITLLLVHPDERTVKPEEKVARIFTGGKARWRTTYDALFTKLTGFGSDVTVAPTNTYIGLLRGRTKFAVVQPTTDRFDIGIKLKGVAPAGRLEASGAWNNMVTHRVRVTDPQQIDQEVLAWLKKAYDAV